MTPTLQKRSILFLTRALTFGGAQRQLCLLAKGLAQNGWDVSVAVFYPDGPLEADLRNSGVSIISLDKRSRWDILSFMLRLRKLVTTLKPNVLHSYLTAPNVIAAAVTLGISHTRLVWGFRASFMDMAAYDRVARATYWLQRQLAMLPSLIINNSHRGLDDAVAAGYPTDKLVAIPNAIDTERFHPDPAGRKTIRDQLQVADNELLIGSVARLDPKKDHETFLRSAAHAYQHDPRLKFVIVGEDVSNRKQTLVALASTLQISTRVHFIEGQQELSRWYSAMDIHCLSSRFGEGFPNVVGEAMACGTLCVVTDCGDAAWIVNNAALCAPTSDPIALGTCLLTAIASNPAQQATAVRQRAINEFSIEALVSNTENNLNRILVQTP